jgi:hypothetical protein
VTFSNVCSLHILFHESQNWCQLTKINAINVIGKKFLIKKFLFKSKNYSICSTKNKSKRFKKIIFNERIIGGAADAAAMGAMLSILMKLFPGNTGKIVAWTGMASGLGHMAGEFFYLECLHI